MDGQLRPIDSAIGQVENGATVPPRSPGAGFVKGTEPNRKVIDGIRLLGRAVYVRTPIAGKLGA